MIKNIVCFVYKIVLSLIEDTPNSRVVSRFGQCFLPEPSGSGFSRMSGLNHADSAADGKHYTKLN